MKLSTKGLLALGVGAMVGLSQVTLQATPKTPQAMLDEFLDEHVSEMVAQMSAQGELYSSIYEQTLKMNFEKPLTDPWMPGVAGEADIKVMTNQDTKSYGLDYDFNMDLEEMSYDTEEIIKRSVQNAGEIRLVEDDLYYLLKGLQLRGLDMTDQERSDMMAFLQEIKTSWVHVDLAELSMEYPEIREVLDSMKQDPAEIMKIMTGAVEDFVATTQFVTATSDELKRVGEYWEIPVRVGAPEFRSMGENGVDLLLSLEPIYASSPEMVEIFAELRDETSDINWDDMEVTMAEMGIGFTGTLSIAANQKDTWKLAGNVNMGRESIEVTISHQPNNFMMTMTDGNETVTFVVTDQRVAFITPDFTVEALKEGKTWVGSAHMMEYGEYDWETYEYMEYETPKKVTVADFEFTTSLMGGAGFMNIYEDGEMMMKIHIDALKVGVLGDKFMIDMKVEMPNEDGEMALMFTMMMDYEYKKRLALALPRPTNTIEFAELEALFAPVEDYTGIGAEPEWIEPEWEDEIDWSEEDWDEPMEDTSEAWEDEWSEETPMTEAEIMELLEQLEAAQ